MMRLRYLLLFPLLLLQSMANATDIYIPFAGKIMHLADSSSAALLTQQQDEYLGELSPFDLAIRFNREGATRSDYTATAVAGVHDWSEQEITQFIGITTALDSVFRAMAFRLPLPDTIHMIRSDTKEEFGAEGYTRLNRIMLNTNILPLGKGLVAHELFHVISRYNKKWRDEIYAVFHFQPCDNIIYKPAFGDRVITNPDCPFLMNYIRAEAGGKQQDMALVLYSKIGFKNGGTINDYAQLGLLALEGKKKKRQPVIKDGQPLVYELDQVPDFFRQAGRNSPYILHIEELCAEHFAALCSGKTLPQQEYLDQMAKVLKH